MFIDMHCDTLTMGAMEKGEQFSLLDFPEAMLDFRRMKKGKMLAQFFAIWTIPEEYYRQWFKMEPDVVDVHIKKCLNLFRRNMKKHSDLIAQALTAEDIIINNKCGKMSAILTIEDSRVLDGDLRKIDWLYEEGIRVMGLTWNQKNCIGSPNSVETRIMEEGLTKFGKEAVEYMQEKGILVDVSHLSDGGFYDVAEIMKKPFVATHSNCRILCNHPRNLTDDMIRTLAEHGGVAGINFAPDFLGDKRSNVKNIVSMIKHMRNVGGIEVVGLGTDFDGIEGCLEISDVSKMPMILNELEKEKFTANEIEAITRGNVLRIMKEVL